MNKSEYITEFINRKRSNTGVYNSMWKNLFFIFVVLISGLIPLTSSVFAANIERVNVTDNGSQANKETCSRPYLSADNRYVVFSSSADNLVQFDTNGEDDVFVYDTHSKQIERISIANDGTEANNWSCSPSISSNGRFVAFNSAASNLIEGDTNNAWDTFVYDRQNKIVERVSIASAGTEGNQGFALNIIGNPVANKRDVQIYTPSISGDGQYVAFASDASNLIAGDTNGKYDIFVYDRDADTIERVSIASDGTEGNEASFNCSISDDGTICCF